jgi:hypothetical protein
MDVDRRNRGGTVTGATGARTPEELETLLEDALLMRDPQALLELVDEGTCLVVGDEGRAQGRDAVMRLALAIWQDERTYVADPLYVLQARDLALIVGTTGISVARRHHDGAWKYAIIRVALPTINETRRTL